MHSPSHGNNLLLNCQFDSNAGVISEKMLPFLHRHHNGNLSVFLKQRNMHSSILFPPSKNALRIMFYRPLRPLMWRFAIQSAKHDKRASSSLSRFFFSGPSRWIVYNLIFIHSWLMGIIYFLCSLPEAVLPARSQPVFLRMALGSIYKHTFRYRWKNRSFTVKGLLANMVESHCGLRKLI